MRPPEPVVSKLVSVVLPTYNRLGVVERAIDSVLAQSYPSREIVVVDDGSTDGTADALSARYGSRIVLVREPHRGVSAARNAGLAVARGDIVAFLDSDNRWRPHHLETVVSALGRFPDVALASTRSAADGDGGWTDSVPFDALPMLLRANVVGHVTACAVPRSVLEQAGGFDERIVAAEDYELWCRLALLGPFVFVARPTLAETGSREDSLWVRGYRDGHVATARQLALEKLLHGLERSERHDREELLLRTRAALALLGAIRAISDGDEIAARTGFSEAARLDPDLLARPETVARAIRQYTPGLAWDNEIRADTFGRAAGLWPDPGSPTGRALRLMALDGAYRARGYPGLAGTLRRTPPPQLPVALRHCLWLLTRARRRLPANPPGKRSFLATDDSGG